MNYRCPHCNAECDYVICYTKGEMKYYVEDGGANFFQYDEQDFTQDEDTDDFVCPECGETLARRESALKQFIDSHPVNSTENKEEFDIKLCSRCIFDCKKDEPCENYSSR